LTGRPKKSPNPIRYMRTRICPPVAPLPALLDAAAAVLRVAAAPLPAGVRGCRAEDSTGARDFLAAFADELREALGRFTRAAFFFAACFIL